MRYKVSKDEEGWKLVDFVAEKNGISRRAAKTLLDRKQIVLNGKRIWIASHKLRRRDTIDCPDVKAEPKKRIELPLLYQDAHYIIINKPALCTSNQHRSSAETLLRKQLDNPKIQAVHRLDKETSGCLIFAISQEAFDAMKPLFQNQEIQKSYLALVHGNFSQQSECRKSISGKTARSVFQPRLSKKNYSLVKAIPETGRTHQLRIHLASLDFPIVGDKKYTPFRAVPKQVRLVPRHMLHASTLSFKSPISGTKIHVEAAPPEDFIEWQSKLVG